MHRPVALVREEADAGAGFHREVVPFTFAVLLAHEVEDEDALRLTVWFARLRLRGLDEPVRGDDPLPASCCQLSESGSEGDRRETVDEVISGIHSALTNPTEIGFFAPPSEEGFEPVTVVTLAVGSDVLLGNPRRNQASVRKHEFDEDATEAAEFYAHGCWIWVGCEDQMTYLESKPDDELESKTL